MGIFSGLFRSRDKPKDSYDSPSYSYFFGRTQAGKRVNDRTAMQIIAVYACVRVLSEAIAQLPLHVYQYTDSGKERVPRHPLYFLLHDQPNPEMTSFVFRETLIAHLLIYGNAYAQIIGKPTGLFAATGGAQEGCTTSGANITFDDMIELFYSLKSPYRKKAKWILNEQTVKALRKIKDNTGNYIWQPSVSNGIPDTILNRPYVTSVYAPTVEAGSKAIAFGDFSYYWIADRQGRSMKRLNELFAMNGQIGFLASQRVDGKLILPEAVKVLTMKG